MSRDPSAGIPGRSVLQSPPVKRSRHVVRRPLPAVVLATLVVVLLPGQGPASTGADRMETIELLVEKGAGELAPTEVKLAKQLAERAASGDERGAHLADLQLDLLSTIVEARDAQQRAEEAEKQALQAQKDVAVQQAAYEFLVEQILASGVAAYWSGP